MIERGKLVDFLDKTLLLQDFPGDYSNNGLQVEGGNEVEKILFAVDACQEVFDTAVKEKCNFIFVHHGLSWGGGIKRWTGIDAKRFATLLGNGISLYAAHLPLDAHPVFGNNAVLADMAELQERTAFFEYAGSKIGISGTFKTGHTLQQLAEILGRQLEVEPLLRGDSQKIIHRAAIVSGGGGLDSIFAAKAADCDLLITGEMEHIMHHAALESGVAVIALGHYASETTGPLAMQKLIADTFPVETVFAEVPTGL